MSASASVDISQPLLVLTDFQGGVAYRSTIGLGVAGGRLEGTLASGTPTAVRGASMSVSNLLQLLDANPATGGAPLFSLPLTATPEFGSVVTGSLQFGAEFRARPSGVVGTVPVRIETGSDHVTRFRVDGNQPPKTMDGVRIDLVDGIEIGSTRVDGAGQSWLDLRFLTLFSYVTEGANLLSLAFQVSEGAGRFFLRFSGLPISISGSPISELQANVVLDMTPNFAPRLELGAGAAVRNYSAHAGKPLAVGADFFFGSDHVSGTRIGIDLVDPVANLAASTPSASSFTAIDDWSRAVARPVLLAQPSAGTVRISGNAIEFPRIEAVSVSLDSTSTTTGVDSGDALFVRLGGDVYRALTFDELERLQFVGSGSQALTQPEVPLSFLIRDAQGALSGEFTAKVAVAAANISGTVRHWASDTPLDGVRIAVQSVGNASAQDRWVESSAAGKWQVDGLDFDQVVAHASRPAQEPDAARSLNAIDVLSALKLATGRGLGATGPAAPTTLSEAQASAIQKVAADFDQDGQVEVDDAASILRVVAGQVAPASVGWRFVTASGEPQTSASAVQVDAVANTTIDWLGVLIGDVDGGWRADAGYPSA